MRLLSLLAAALFAVAPLSAGAVTVVSKNGSYDILSDDVFSGTVVDKDGGKGSYKVNFFSLIDPTKGFANAAITSLNLKTFKGLKMMWVDSASKTVLQSGSVKAGITSLDTIFASPYLSQDLVFKWKDSKAGVSLNFDVTGVATPIPVPAAGLLMVGALGGLGLIGARRRSGAA